MKLRKEYKEAIICTLKCYPLLESHIEDLNSRQRELEQHDGLSSSGYNITGIRSSNINKITEKTALQNIEELSEIMKSRQQALLKLERLSRAIDDLSETEQIIVECRYVKGMSWFETIEEANYSQRMCHRKLDEAVEKLAYIFYGDQAFDSSVKVIS